MNINFTEEEVEKLIKALKTPSKIPHKDRYNLLKKLYNFLELTKIVDRPFDDIKKSLERLHEDKPPRNT